MTEKMKPSNLCDVMLPVGWECARFRKLFSFGKGLSITKEDLVDEGVPVISYGQVHSKANTGTAIHESLIRFVPESYLKTDKQALTQEGNFIFADTSEDLSGVGNCAFVNTTETLFAGYHSIIARPKDTNMHPKYFAYQFLTDIWRDQIRAKVMGVKVFSISQKLLRDTTVFIPPLQEQKAIAKLLDIKCAKIDSVIADIEKQIEALQKYKKSLITETVTKGLDQSVQMKDSGCKWVSHIPAHWSIKRFKYLLKYITDGSHFSPETVDEGYPYITAADVRGLGLDYQAAKKISNQDFIALQRTGCQPKVGDVLLVKDGATTGRIGMVTSDYPCVVLSSVAILRAPESMDCRYLRYLMESEFVQSQIQASMAGSAMPRTVLSKIVNYLGIECPKDEQIGICDYLDEKCANIDSIISQKEKQLEAITQHKKSLIYEYVTGKKRVMEVN